MTARQLDVGIGGRVGPSVIVYVRDDRGNTWTKAFPDSSDVLHFAEAEWRASTTGWHYSPGDGQLSEFSRVFEHGTGALYVTGEPGIRTEHLLREQIDVVVSLNESRSAVIQEVLHAMRERKLKHVRAPIKDLLPEHQSERDEERAALAVRSVLNGLIGGRRVVVHCLLGVHRSPALATAVVKTLSDGITIEEAYRRVHASRAAAMWVPETAAWFESLAREATRGSFPPGAHLEGLSRRP